MMGSVRYISGIIALVLLLVPAVQAQQDQQFGYIDSDYILEQMPEYQGIEDQLESTSRAWREEIEQMRREIEDMQEEFEAREILFTPEVRREREEEIEAKIREKEDLIEEKFGPDGEYFERQQELLEPLQREIMEAVHTIAERDGFDFIFDRSGDHMFMHADRQWDLSEEVLLEMGLRVEEDLPEN